MGDVAEPLDYEAKGLKPDLKFKQNPTPTHIKI